MPRTDGLSELVRNVRSEFIIYHSSALLVRWRMANNRAACRSLGVPSLGSFG